jgi:ubiquitin C-terminal hydrolase
MDVVWLWPLLRCRVVGVVVVIVEVCGKQALFEVLDQEGAPSPAAQLWTGKTRTRMQCTRCGAETETVEVFSDLDLALPSASSGGLSVQSLVHSALLQCETLTGDNKFHCGRCAEFVDGQRRVDVVESPAFLMVTLVRFAFKVILFVFFFSLSIPI